MGPGEEITGLVGIAQSAAFSKHSSPRKSGAGSEEFGTHPVAELCGLVEVGVRLVVATEDGKQAAEIVADRAQCRCARRRQLTGPRREPVEQRPGVFRVPAFDSCLGVVDHSGEPDLVQGEIEVFGSELIQQDSRLVGTVPLDVGLGQ